MLVNQFIDIIRLFKTELGYKVFINLWYLTAYVINSLFIYFFSFLYMLKARIDNIIGGITLNLRKTFQ